MAKKQKALIIFTATTFLSIGAAVLIAVSKAQEEKYDGVFTPNINSVEQIDTDTYQIPLSINSTGASIRVNFTGIDGDEIQNEVIATNGTNDMYLYNVDAIRGIAHLGFTLNSDSSYSGSVYVAAYLSYSPLNLEDIFNGNYKDLTCISNVINLSSSDPYNMHLYAKDFADMISSRYALVAVVPDPSRNGHIEITNLSCSSICGDEPTLIDKENDEGVISADEKNIISVATGGSAGNVTQVGNRSYNVRSSSINGSPFLFLFDDPSSELPIISELTNNFENTYNFGNISYYQRNYNDKVYTLFLTKVVGNYFQVMTVSCYDTIGYMSTTTQWPETFIKNNIKSTEYKNLVLPFVSTLIENYTSLVQTIEDDLYITVVATLKDGYTYNDIVEDGTEYFGQYVAIGFVVTSSHSDETYSGVNLVYDNGLFGIQMYASDDYMRISFWELPTLDEYPTNEYIAEHFLRNADLADYLVRYTGSGVFRIQNSNSVTIYKASFEDIDAYKQSLLAAGYILTNSGYYYLSLNDVYGSYINIRVSSDSIRYIYTDASQLYQQMNMYATFISEVFNGEQPENVPDIQSHLLEGATFWYNIYVSDNQIRYVILGAGQDYYDTLIYHFTHHGGYSPVGDFYYLDEDNNYGYRFIYINGDVAIIKINGFSYFKKLGNYDSYNYFLAQVASEDEAIYLDESDNIPEKRFRTDQKCIQYYGTLDEINSFITILSNKILANTDFKYSPINDNYVNTVTGFAYSFSVESVNYNNILCLTVNLSKGATYQGYSSFNELELGSNELLTHFPELDVDKDEELFYIDSSTDDSLVLRTKLDPSSYMQSLISDHDFVMVANNAYFVDENGTLYFFNFSNSASSVKEESYLPKETCYTMRFYREVDHTFKSIDTLWNEDNKDIKEFVDEFYFTASAAFNSSYPAYSIDSEHGVVIYLFNVQTEINNYLSYITSNGFVLAEDSSYKKYNGNFIYTLGVYIDGGIASLYFMQAEYSFVSWNTIVSAFNSAGYEYDSLKDVIPHPIASGNIYELTTANPNFVQLKVSKQFNLNEYITTITSNEHYLHKSNNVYFLEDGKISINSTNIDYYNIAIIVSSAGNSFDNAINVSVGSTVALLTGPLTYFVFTPEEDGTYIIQSSSSSDTYGYLYDSSHNELASNDDGGNNNNFKISYDLTAGETYYIGARLFSQSSTQYVYATIDISLDQEINTQVERWPTVKEVRSFMIVAHGEIPTTSDDAITHFIYENDMHTIGIVVQKDIGEQYDQLLLGNSWSKQTYMSLMIYYVDPYSELIIMLNSSEDSTTIEVYKYTEVAPYLNLQV